MTIFFHHQDYDESTMNARGVAQTVDGSFLVSGYRTYHGACLCKFDPDGNVIWSKSTSESQYFGQMESTPNGDVMISGGFNSNPLLIRLDSQCNPMWSKAYDGVAYGGVTGFARTSDNGIAVIGQTIDMAPGSSNVYFLKIDSAGEPQFSRTFGNTLWDAGRGVVEADDGGYFIVAWSQSFGFNSPMCVIKTDSIGGSDCYEYNDTTTVVDVQLNWNTFVLDILPSLTERYPSACSIRSGTTVLDLCSVGVNEASPSPIAIHVFPNPTHGGFIVSIASDYAGSEIGIFNALGERVYSAKAVQPETRIDLTSFPRGMYLVKVSTGRSAVVEKVVLE